MARVASVKCSLDVSPLESNLAGALSYPQIYSHSNIIVNLFFRLPYLEAFILEMNRYYTLLPIIGPRRTTKPTKLGGYNIPKVCINYYLIYFESNHLRKLILKSFI